MVDESDNFEKLVDRFRASPQLMKAWQTSAAIESSYAWYLLNHSGEIDPKIPGDYIPHAPRLRIWDDARGWTDSEPFTLTVYRGRDEATLCRHAVWHSKRPGEIKRRLVEFVNSEGQVQFHGPEITVADANVPFVELTRHLEKIAACTVPAICPLDPETQSVTTDIGSVGFEYFSQDQPPARISYQWSFDFPDEWKPLLEEVSQLRDFLLGCFKSGKE